jgi:hypothetical protein
LTLFAVLIPIQAQEETPFLETDFEDGQIPAGVLTSGNWQVITTDIEGRQSTLLWGEAAGDRAELLLLDAEVWGSYALEMQVKFSGTGSVTLNTQRDRNNQVCETGFFLEAAASSDTRLDAVGSNCSRQTIASPAGMRLPLDQWFALRIETSADHINIYVNTQPVLSGQATVPARGLARLVINGAMQVEINALRAARIDSPPVFAQGIPGLIPLQPLVQNTPIVAAPTPTSPDPAIVENPVEPYFQTGFEDGQLPPSLMTFGDWRIVDTTLNQNSGAFKALQGVGIMQPAELFMLDAEVWGDYALEMQIRFNGTGRITLNTQRDRNNQLCETGFFLEISVIDNYTRLEATQPNCSKQVLVNGEGVRLPLNQWFLLRAEVTDNRMSVYINGEPFITANASVPSRGVARLVLAEDMRVDINGMRALPLEVKPQLTTYQGSPADILTELRAKNFVPQGGSLVFLEPYTFYRGITAGLIPLARFHPHTDFVMGGDMSFQSGSTEQLEYCSMVGRVSFQAGEGVTGLLQLVVTNQGTVAVQDRSAGVEPTSAVSELNLDLSQVHHVLVVAVQDRVWVFIDGVLVIQDMLVPIRQGFFGLLYSGASHDSLCEVRNFWVYTTDATP